MSGAVSSTTHEAAAGLLPTHRAAALNERFHAAIGATNDYLRYLRDPATSVADAAAQRLRTLALRARYDYLQARAEAIG